MEEETMENVKSIIEFLTSLKNKKPLITINEKGKTADSKMGYGNVATNVNTIPRRKRQNLCTEEFYPSQEIT